MEYEEFTDRVELLRELETWIKNVCYKRSGSTSIISPRGGNVEEMWRKWDVYDFMLFYSIYFRIS